MSVFTRLSRRQEVPVPEPVPELVLPPVALRMGGQHFVDDGRFVETAVADVVRLTEVAGLTSESRLLDWGCGAGRLAVGVQRQFGRIADYHGVDVQRHLIDWSVENFGDPGYRFTWVDVSNARYNPIGAPEREIPADPESVDVFYAYSVFSHMLEDDTAAYLRLIATTLAPAGAAWITCFVEEGVGPCEENPAGYGPFAWAGPLHCVRYDRSHFEELVAAAGLVVDRFVYGRETDGQSEYVLTRASRRA